LRALRLSFPDARIDALVTPNSATLLRGSDAVDRIVRFDKFAFDRPTQAISSIPKALGLGRQLRAARYDTLVLLHHLTTTFGTAKYVALTLGSGAPIRAGLDNGRGRFLTHRARDEGFGACHEVDYWLSVVGALGATNSHPRLELPIPPAAEAAAAERWAALGLDGERAAVVHPGSGAFSLARRWPPDRFATLADRLTGELGLRVAVLAGPAPGEAELARDVLGMMHARGTLLEAIPSVQELAAVLSRGALFVGNDSGVMHVAAAVERPIVAIFGPTNHRAWGPYPPDAPRHAIVREPLACSPCIHRGHSFGTPSGCPARTCLDLVSVEMVFEAARKIAGRAIDGRGESCETLAPVASDPSTPSPTPAMSRGS
jgi:heptosyltransferase-2